MYNLPIQGLANIFNGVTAYIPPDHPEFEKLTRYVIAYNGDVADKYGLEDATHIVVDKHIKVSAGVLFHKNLRLILQLISITESHGYQTSD